ncbi:permease prefix domain 2-containing transporter [Rheinheimera soli]|uniref:Chemotaxis protein MotA n=1 Tax=Rheinheimera soli TaxID=443616 RepID=A0ABU1W1K5_9GAMM|nr:permease prefix domain 2-containing transporter [Rheinheimera soli]MDR7121839.1 chemotaxis protein MotA [Rheinheimera soli]
MKQPTSEQQKDHKSHQSEQPPLLCQRLLEWVLPDALQEPVLGDLQEEFIERQQQNHSHACWWYRQQALSSCWHFIYQTKGDWLMFVLSVVFFIGLSLWAMVVASAGNSWIFYDFISLLLIIPPALLFAVGATSRQTSRQAMAFLVNPRQGANAQTYQQIRHFFDVMGNSALLLGFVSTLIGVVAIANAMNAENFAASFGEATAVCLLTLLYGCGLKTLCYIAAQKVSFVAQETSQDHNVLG